MQPNFEVTIASADDQPSFFLLSLSQKLSQHQRDLSGMVQLDFYNNYIVHIKILLGHQLSFSPLWIIDLSHISLAIFSSSISLLTLMQVRDYKVT